MHCRLILVFLVCKTTISIIASLFLFLSSWSSSLSSSSLPLSIDPHERQTVPSRNVESVVTVTQDRQVVHHVDVNGDNLIMKNQNAAAQQEPPKLPPTQKKKKKLSRRVRDQIQQLTHRAFSVVGHGRPQEYKQIWLQVLALNPRNEHAVLQLGLIGMTSKDKQEQKQAYLYIEQSFDSTYVDQTIVMPSPPGIYLSMSVARYHWEQRHYNKAHHFFTMAYNASMDIWNNKEGDHNHHHHHHHHDTEQQQQQSPHLRLLQSSGMCAAIALATMLHPYPTSTQHATTMLQQYIQAAQDFLQRYNNNNDYTTPTTTTTITTDSSSNTKNKQKHKRRQTGSSTFLLLDERTLAQTVAGSGEDPYVYCALSLFHLSFYHHHHNENDQHSNDSTPNLVVKAAKLRHDVVARVWPQLLGEKDHNDEQKEDTTTTTTAIKTTTTKKPCISTTTTTTNNNNNNNNNKGKIQLGIASGFLSPQSSVAADFGGVLSRLNRTMFHITYLHFCSTSSSSSCSTDDFVYQHVPQDQVMLFRKDPSLDKNNGTWMTRFYPTIQSLDLDILLYLDITMSPVTTRMAMNSQLAKVLATTHGHPMTSGINAIQYYISWGAAELPKKKEAQQHYSETLVLLNPRVPHQYYEPRHRAVVLVENHEDHMSQESDKNDHHDHDHHDNQRKNHRRLYSIIDDKRFDHLAHRSTFSSWIPDTSHDKNWYTCMQKPHKFMPDMDPLICGILHHDPHGIVLLHQADTEEIQQSFLLRLQQQQQYQYNSNHKDEGTTTATIANDGSTTITTTTTTTLSSNYSCDITRIYFLPVQPHHRLLALYMVSTVILDSYPAGGCTTTREVLELSKPVMTWPSTFLGGRWTYAYYQILFPISTTTTNNNNSSSHNTTRTRTTMQRQQENNNDEGVNTQDNNNSTDPSSVFQQQQDHLIALNAQDYIIKAVALGKNTTLRHHVERLIQDNLYRLYYQESAVSSWQDILLQIAPVDYTC